MAAKTKKGLKDLNVGAAFGVNKTVPVRAEGFGAHGFGLQGLLYTTSHTNYET